MDEQQTVLENSCVAIFLDWQNSRALNASQIYRLNQFATRFGTVELKYAYADWAYENRNLEEVLLKLEFDCFDVISSRKKKNRVDQLLMKHCEKYVLSNTAIKTVILMSGDGDFKKMVRKLQTQNKRVIVIPQSLKICSRKLREIADEFYILEQVAA